ncbi:hypothetical protein ACMATS_05915 [Streptoverticillium reticulum]|uniref:hypothetical protein n=1 Tax=Streptoverticillium reticulum TaxID=1433415 RepID=UPI0039BF680B
MNDKPDPYQYAEAVHRMAAAVHRTAAAAHGFSGAAVRMGGAMRCFTEALSVAEAAQIARHPDLAELNIQLDNYYG